MGKWISTSGNTVTISPFNDKGYKFITLDCEESIGGKFAHGRIEMVHDGNPDAVKLITDQETVDIELGTTDLGPVLVIHGVIMHRDYYKNHLDIDFVCVPEKDIFTNRGYLVYDDIDSAIKSLWKGKIDNRTKTDLPSGIKYNQGGEFDSKFLGVLCESYKKDTIYACGLDNLLIKDLIGIDSTGNKEPHWTMMGHGDHVIQQTESGGEGGDRYSLYYDYKLYKKPENAWEEASGVPSKNLDALIFDDRYRIVHKDYNILRENLYNNQKLYNSRMYNQLHVTHTTFLQSYRLGDVIYYKRPGETDKIPFKIYIISKISYHYRTEPSSEGTTDTFPFKLEYTLHCLEEKGVVLNDSDPKDE